MTFVTGFCTLSSVCLQRIGQNLDLNAQAYWYIFGVSSYGGADGVSACLGPATGN
jgi:hypothetical protein